MPPPGLNLTGRLDLAGAKLSRTDARDWLARAAVWFETVGDAVLDAQLGRDADGRPVLGVSLHPAADDVEVRLSSGGALRVTAVTGPAGPGYHAHLCGMLEAFADDFDAAWERADDPTGFYLGRDFNALGRCFLDCLQKKCRALTHTAAEWAGTPIPLGLPADHGFTHPGPVLTTLGPRGPDWLAAVAADPAAGRDHFPWHGPDLDAAFYRDRAAVLMWCDFPWRPPLTEDEGELTDQIAADLATAHALDPSARLPWREWAEVIACIENDTHGLTVEPIDPGLKVDVLKRAAALDPAAPRIGYRRLPVRVPVGGGWSVEVPGSFAEDWSADGRAWTGWDDRRRAVVGVGSPPEPPETGWRMANPREGLWCHFTGVDPTDREWAEAVWQSARREPESQSA